MADVRADIQEHPAVGEKAQHKRGERVLVGRAETVMVGGVDFPFQAIRDYFHATDRMVLSPARPHARAKGVRLIRAGATAFLRANRESGVIDAQIALHVFMAVLVVGTIFRLLSYHAMASPNVHLQHLGSAMATQY